MDPQSGNAKRKRGRPAAAVQSEPQEERVSKRKRVENSKSAAETTVEEAPLPENVEPTKRKRGRPSNASIAEQTQDVDQGSPRATRKERVKQSDIRRYATGGQENVEETRGSRGKKRVDYSQKRKHSSGKQDEGSSQAKKNGPAENVRSAPIDQEAQGEKEAASNVAVEKSRAGRPPKSKQAESTEQEEPESTTNGAPKRKQNSRAQETLEEGPVQPPKKRGRPSLTTADQVGRAQPELDQQNKRRGRSSNANTDADEDGENQPESTIPKKSRGRPSNADEEAPVPERPVDQTKRNKKKRDEQIPENAPKRKKQRRTSPEPEAETIPQNTEIAHQRLVPREHKINRDIIDTKWNPLPTTAISRISTLLHEAERPVYYRIEPSTTRNLAQSAISTIISRVERKLRKGLPFPPSSTRSHNREEDFDLEKISKWNRGLESQLTVLGHSNELLEADRRREEILLEQETALLKRMEASAKEEERFNRAELRKSDHLLLRNSNVEDDAGDLTLATRPRVDLSKLQQDEDLKPTIKQMHGHLESMQGNMEQIAGIGDAITESRAAIEDVLFRHFDEKTNDAVLLG